MHRRTAGTKLLLSLLLLCLAALAPVSGQQILTAVEYFDTVAANYADIESYIAEVIWSDEGGRMWGTLLYKQPNLIRIDFESPEDQWLVSDGELFMIYVPAFNVVLQQELRDTPGTGTPAGLATEEGLAIMRRSYDVAYLEGPEPVPLDEGSDFFVTRLRLDRKQVTEGFRQIVLSIDTNGYIRRIVGTKVDWEEVQMDLADIQINQIIPDARFEGDPDASASLYENFLFDPEG